MKRAIFRSVLALMCIYSIFSGFSSKSFANEKVRGFVISTESDIKTIEKVNNRIINNTEGGIGYNSYVVNINNKIDFTLAGLLALSNNGLVVPINGDTVDISSMEILKNSKHVYIVGDYNSVADDVLSKLGILFERIGSVKGTDTNVLVNEFRGDKDLLVVDFKENSDVLGALYYANTYNMNLLLVDSKEKLTANNVEAVTGVDEKHYIYFYDGVNTFSNDYKKELYTLSKKDIQDFNSYSLDGRDVRKIFKDRFYTSNNFEKLVLSESNLLTDMLYSYIMSEKSNDGFLLINENEVDKEIEDMIKASPVKDITLVSTSEYDKFIPIRIVMSSVNEEDFSNFEFNSSEGEIVSFTSDDTKGHDNASEEVSVSESETIVNGKVVSKEELKKQEESKAQVNLSNEKSTKSEAVPSVDFEYSKVLTMNATAYSNDPAENAGYTTTKLGTPLRHGVVAVDPKVIPLGTKLYIEGYGYAVAEDTGGAIKGNKIDLCFTDKALVHAFGRRNVKVYVLK